MEGGEAKLRLPTPHLHTKEGAYMRQLLLAGAMLVSFGSVAFAATPAPPPPHSPTVTSVIVVNGGGTSTANLHSTVPGIGTVALGASISTHSSIGIAASFSVGFSTP